MLNSSLKQIANKLHLPFDDPFVKVSGVSVDSRNALNDNLFFALPGGKGDGHNYLSEARANGALAAVVKKGYSGPSYGMPLLYCDDVLAALQLLAKGAIEESGIKVVAVTGSIGKTTTKDFIASLLKEKFSVFSSPGNNNSQIGLPLAILNHLNPKVEIAILEMGMTHPGQIAKLVQIAPPDVALITKVALVHACNFDSLDAIAYAKAEVFSHPKTSLAIYPKECRFDSIFRSSADCRKLTFSTRDKAADYFLESHDDNMTIRTHSGWLSKSPILPLPGEHNRHNFLAAAVAARHLGMGWDEIRIAQEKLILPKRRLEMIEKDGIVFVNDSYNASEISLKSALSSLPNPKGVGLKIAVIGEMLELGKFSKQCHHEVGKHALGCVDTMICIGIECSPIYDCWKAAQRPVYWAMDREELIQIVRNRIKRDDVVLLKGSRSNELWKILENF